MKDLASLLIVKRIIELVPQDLRDDETGVIKYSNIFLNSYTKLTAKRDRQDTDLLTSVVLKAGPDERRRTYDVNNTINKKPLSYHFWKMVRAHTERMMSKDVDKHRKQKLRKVVYDAAKTYIDFANINYASRIDAYQNNKAQKGLADDIQVGFLRDDYQQITGDTLCLRLSLKGDVPKLISLIIQNKHLSLETVKKIMELVDAETAKPIDMIKNKDAVKKERVTLFD